MRKICVFALVACLFLTACETSGETIYNGVGNLMEIDGNNTLFYDKDTRIIYYMMTADNFGYKGYGFMSQYISENGNYCRYVNREIVEIE